MPTITFSHKKLKYSLTALFILLFTVVSFSFGTSYGRKIIFADQSAIGAANKQEEKSAAEKSVFASIYNIFYRSTDDLAPSAVFVVNDNGDSRDLTPGNGVCLDAEGKCTLRAAIQEANLLPGIDTINFDFLNPEADTIQLDANISPNDLLITEAVKINGPGARTLTIIGNYSNTAADVFNITANPNTKTEIRGITVRRSGRYGFSNTGNLELSDVAIKENRGAGIFNSAKLMVNRALIDSNENSGIRLTNTANAVSISNTTITRNSSANNGGGINTASGDVTLNNVTISHNTAGNNSGGGLYYNGTNLGINVRNTIIAVNNAVNGPDVFANTGVNFNSRGNNLISKNGGNNGFGSAPGDKTGTLTVALDAKLGDLQNNGGQTDTRALDLNSPARDAGNACVYTSSCPNTNPAIALDTDQRGTDFRRLFETAVDMGAFETFYPKPAITTLSPGNWGTGRGAFVLTVNGNNFVADSKVRWNGVEKTTAFVSNNQLTAQISASDVTTAGQFQITVVNPQPNPGPSDAVVFKVENCTYTIDPTSMTVPATGGDRSVALTTPSGCAWTAQSNRTWITVNSNSTGGTVSANISFNVQPNTGAERSGSITIGGQNGTQTLTITQPKNCTFTLTGGTPTVFSNTGGTGSVFLEASDPSCTWTTQSNNSWITSVTPASSNGTKTVLFSVQANTGAAREGTITIADKTYTVNQETGCAFTLSPTTRNHPASGGTNNFTVSTATGCTWSPTTTDSWITVSRNANTVTYSVQPNTGAQRTGKIKVGNQEFTVTQDSGCTYTLNPTSHNFTPGGGTKEIIVTAPTGCTWTAAVTSPNSTWVTITSGANGSGGKVVISVSQNTGASRTATLTIAGQAFSVIQDTACTFTLTPTATAQPIPGAGGSGSFGVSTTPATCTWSASSNQTWITVTGGASGTGNGTVNFTVAANPDATSRSGMITVNGQNFTVNQAPRCTFQLNTNTIPSFASAGGNTNVQLTTQSGCAWTAQTTDSWITNITPASGSNSQSIAFTILQNTGAERTGTIRIGDQTLTVPQQSGCIFTLSATSVTIPKASATHTVGLTATNANCTWTAQSNAPWITSVTPVSSNGSKTISYTVAANTGPARTGSITIAGKEFTVTQDSGCTYLLTETSSPVISSAGGNGSVNLTVNTSQCEWLIENVPSWVTITSGMSGSGNKTVTYTVQPNPGPAREGTFKIAGISYTVKQALGCSYTLSPESANVPAELRTHTVNLIVNEPGCAWTAQTSDSWITITSGNASGSGSKEISYTVAANTGPERRGSITIAGKVFPVIQQSGCVYTLEPTEARLPKAGGGSSFNVNVNDGRCVWNASVVGTSTWIRINGSASGSGNGIVNFSVEANITPERKGEINVSGKIFTVWQDNGCGYVLSPDRLTVAPAAGTGSFTVNTGGGCQWTATEDVPWITITGGASGNRTGTVNFSFTENKGPQRTGEIKVNGQTFTLTQTSGCGYTLSTQVLNVPATISSQTITVTATDPGCTWVASTSTTWITITSGSTGQGNGAVNIEIAANDGLPRNGSLTIAGKTVNVIQANGCVYTLNPNDTSIDELGGIKTFNVTVSNSACQWTATSNNTDWLTVTAGSSGTGNGTVTLSILGNLNGDERIGTVTVGGEVVAARRTFRVTQVSLTVRNIEDDGPGSLRQAVRHANNSRSNDVITFAPSFHNSSNFIRLTTGEIEIGDSTISGTLEIQGPGADKLTISGNNNSRIFYINNAIATIKGLTLTAGNGLGKGADASYKVGGAVFVYLGVTTFSGIKIISNDIMGDVARRSQNNGGAIYYWYGVRHRIENSTIAGNRSTFGGGITVIGDQNDEGLTIYNSTFVNNTAASEGGGIYAAGNIRLRSVTIVNNTLTETTGKGAGLGIFGGNIDFGNTIIAGNNKPGSNGPDNSLPEITWQGGGMGISRGYNLIGDATNDSKNTVSLIEYQTSDILDTPPLTGMLWDYGGKTTTVALLPGSPAIDKGNNDFALSNTDQRGAARIVNGRIDIGAFENNIKLTPVEQTLTPGSVGVFYEPGVQITASRIPHNPSSQEQFRFELIDGVLPNGAPPITLSERGFIGNGTPSEPGIYTFVVKATGADGMSAANKYSINIGCPLTFSATNASYTEVGGTGFINVTGASGCFWNAFSPQNWITIVQPSGGNGNGRIDFVVAPNNGPAREGVINAGGQTIRISQAAGAVSCTYNLTPDSATFTAAGGSASFNVVTQPGCSWTADESAPWVSLPSNTASGTGSGTVTYSVAPTPRFRRTTTITIGTKTFTINQAARTAFDFDGDGQADVSIFRPSDESWYTLKSKDSGFQGVKFGYATDKLTPADYDGDGRTDVSVFRDGFWYRNNSSTGLFVGAKWGQAGDVPVPGDYDGDLKADLAVFRDGNWYIQQSSNGEFRGVQFGVATDIPVPADYDGDFKTDIAVFRDGNWYWLKSTDGTFYGMQFGIPGDKPVVGDYDGDGKADPSVVRNAIWYFERSSAGFTGMQFGVNSDLPTPADYDGDGKTDVSVFRDGAWYHQLSFNQEFKGLNWGFATDKPIQRAFIP